MKCTYVKAVNYIGIYSGLGLYEFELDLSKSTNKILMLVGRNGSGKSTIASDILCPTASSLTDVNRKKVILKKKDGYKEIHYSKDESTSYIIKHHFKSKYDSKNDKYSHSVKSFIVRITNGEAVDLNPNGNVTSFKEVLESEFEFDSNSAKLLSLSSEGSSFVNMSFTERKNYINEAKDDLEAYSNFNKSVTAKYRDVKTLLGSVVDALSRIGDIDILTDQYDSNKLNIDKYKNELNELTRDLAIHNNSYNELSSNNNLKSTADEINNRLGKLNSNIMVLDDVLNNYKKSNTFGELTDEQYNSIYLTKQIDKMNHEVEILKNQIMVYDNTVNDSLKDIEKYKEMLDDKNIKLESYTDGLDINVINETKQLCEEKISKYEEAFKDIGELDTDTLIKADNLISSIRNSLSVFQANYTNASVEDLISLYDKDVNPTHAYTKIKMSIIDTKSNITNELNKIEYKLSNERAKLDTNIDNSLRPSNCIIINCPLASTDNLKNVVNSKILDYEAIADNYKTELNDINKEIEKIDADIEMSISWSNIINNISMNHHILSHVPDKRIIELLKFDNMLYALHHNKIRLDFHLGRYIEASQLYGEYQKYKDHIYPKIIEKLNLYNSRVDLINELKSSINEITTFVNKYKKEMDIARSRINKNTKTIATYEQLIPKIALLINHLTDYSNACNERNELAIRYNSIKNDISKLIKIESDMRICENNISNTKKYIEQLDDTQLDLNHKMSTYNEFNDKRVMLEKRFRRYDVMRTILSARTGIPLVFMEVYLKETAIFANQLLDLVVKGKYQLLDFVINENEFRIPCSKLGGECVDDVKAMSQGERSIISICLSFALAYQASSIYNILTLDEMDGPLDVIYKEKYIEVMEKQIALFNTEQIVMISHNDAFFNYPVDIILLDGHDKIIKDNLPLANIIYKHK